MMQKFEIMAVIQLHKINCTNHWNVVIIHWTSAKYLIHVEIKLFKAEGALFPNSAMKQDLTCQKKITVKKI